MENVTEKVTTTIKTHKSVDLDSQSIVELLRSAMGIPDGARVYFTVPGGGDWSNCILDISVQNPITVEWTEQVVK